MKILLSGNMQIIKKYVSKGAKVGFIPTASEVEDDRSYMRQNKATLCEMGFEIVNIEISTEDKADIVEKLNEIDALYVADGNCFYLLQQIKRKNIMQEIIDFANEKIYIGASAGSCIASPSVGYVDNLDDKNAAPLLTDYNALNLINAHILPHYKSSEEYSALIDKIIVENPTLKFITLTNNQAVIAHSREDYRVEFCQPLKLVRLTEEYKEQLFDMMDEWTASGEKIFPAAISINDYHNFDYYMKNLCREKEINGIVPETTYFCLDTERNIFVGAVTVRHYLTEKLKQNGGHIGDGIRPSERRKGFATAMIRLALDEAGKLGISKVLMCCDKRNIASAKSIMNNGGVLENEVQIGDVIKQRYWINNEM